MGNRKHILMLIVLALAAGCRPLAEPRIRIQTGLGDIVLALNSERAPVTVANFMRYVDEGKFKHASFYRVVHEHNQPDDSVRIAVIQGGLWYSRSDTLYPAIEHETTRETGIRHLDGTISMARSEPGTATAEFFICVGDMPELDFGGRRNPDGQGFAAFGRVIEGMDIVRLILRQPAEGQALAPRIVIHNIVRMD